mgnify:CR=1 FL=1
MTENNDRRNNVQPPPQYGRDNRGIRDEEYAMEFAPEQTGVREDANSTYGWIGIVLSVLSFLVWPLFFGVAGIVFGFVSRSKGADALGNFAIGIGVLSILIRIIF